jgi:hypothetical protein
VCARETTHGYLHRTGIRRHRNSRTCARNENRLVGHSQSIDWRFLYAILEKLLFAQPNLLLAYPSLIYHLGRPTALTRRIEGTRREKPASGLGAFLPDPWGATTEWEHCGHPEILQVYLRQSIYESPVSEMYGCEIAKAELVPRFAILDPLREQLAITITSALRDGSVEDGLYVDTPAHMIAVHLARRHCSRSRVVHGPATKAVPGSKMRRLIEFVEENLTGT